MRHGGNATFCSRPPQKKKPAVATPDLQSSFRSKTPRFGGVSKTQKPLFFSRSQAWLKRRAGLIVHSTVRSSQSNPDVQSSSNSLIKFSMSADRHENEKKIPPCCAHLLLRSATGFFLPRFFFQTFVLLRVVFYLAPSRLAISLLPGCARARAHAVCSGAARGRARGRCRHSLTHNTTRSTPSHLHEPRPVARDVVSRLEVWAGAVN